MFAVMHDFPLVMTGKMEVAREHVPRIGASGAGVSVAVRPALVLAGIPLRLVSVKGPGSALAVVAVQKSIVRSPGVVIDTDVVA